MEPGSDATAHETPASTVTITQQNAVSAPTLTLRLQKPKVRQRGARRLQWSEETVDNENAGKKKSKSELTLASLPTQPQLPQPLLPL